jgi:S-adenosylmethionine:tRNA ribosyltransferase-isomerase
VLTSDFSYDLPDSRIAKHPLPDRTASKLLVLGPEGTITHSQFFNLNQFLPAGAALVLNESRVLPARLPMLTESGNPVEILLLEPMAGSAAEALGKRENTAWIAMIGGKRKWKEGAPVFLDSHTKLDVKATWLNRENDTVRLEWQPEDLTLAEVLDVVGQMPLPPYLQRPATTKDKDRYQTTYAQEAGAVAAPTAGLHFTPHLLQEVQEAGHPLHRLTLHVGAGTFKPVKTEHLEDHDMHAERYHLTLGTLLALANEKGPLVPVGTTSLRTLESLYWRGASILIYKEDQPALSSTLSYELAQEAKSISFSEALLALHAHLTSLGQTSCTGSTALYIRPGYRYKSCVALITNFHQPNSTLLALVSALVVDRWKEVYQQALENGYRFLSYGDSSLLFRIEN